MTQIKHFNWLLIITTLTFLFSSNVVSEESKIASQASKSLLLDVTKLSSGRLVSVGERGHILISEDNGSSWRQVVTPVNINLTAIDFFDENNGVAVGFEQTIMITKDAGESWELKHQLENAVDSPAFFDVEYVNKSRIIAVGAYGLYFQSNDAGDSWSKKSHDTLSDIYGGFSHFYGIAQAENTNLLYLVGEKYVADETENGEEISTGLVAISTNSGLSWSKVSSPYSGSFFGVNVAPNKSVYAYGLKGNIFRSYDLGQNWQQINLNSESGIHDIEFNDKGQWFAVGTSGVLINGETLSVNKRLDLKGRAALSILDDNQLVIVGEGGVELEIINTKQED